jgi:hypothetical protein
MLVDIRTIIKRNLHPSFLQTIRRHKNRKYNKLSPAEIFTKIYEDGAWGRSKDSTRPFYSGSGSHEGDEVFAFVESVGNCLRSFEKKPNVVDLGSGDFAVGSQIRNFCDSYIACDVVASLVNFNKVRFKDLAVDFRVLDLIEDDLPRGDVAIVRQVLQHLSNDQIQRFISRIASTYKYIIVSEHLPSDRFAHNIDKPTGPGTRMGYESGIVLTSPPFNLRAKFEKELCRVTSADPGVVVTTLYAL